MYYRYRAGYKKFLIDVNTDYCAYQKNQIGSAVLDLIHEQFKEYTTNLWQPCPFHPSNVSIDNLPLTASLVKNLFVPAGDYKLVVNTTFGEEHNAGSLMMMYVTVPAGRTLEDDNMG